MKNNVKFVNKLVNFQKEFSKEKILGVWIIPVPFLPGPSVKMGLLRTFLSKIATILKKQPKSSMY